MTPKSDPLADALRDCFVSRLDDFGFQNADPHNVVDALAGIAGALHHVADRLSAIERALKAGAAPPAAKDGTRT